MPQSVRRDKDKEEEDRSVRQRVEGFVPEILKRTFYAGLGAVFSTEEGLRRLATEFSLPKDVAAFLISQAQTTKEEILRIIAGEIRSFLQNADLEELIKRLLTSVSFEIKTEIRFIPNSAAGSSSATGAGSASAGSAAGAPPVPPDPASGKATGALGRPAVKNRVTVRLGGLPSRPGSSAEDSGPTTKEHSSGDEAEPSSPLDEDREDPRG